MAKTTLIIGDVHAPYINKKSLRNILSLAEEMKPDLIIQIGDAYDLYSFSRFPKSLNYLTPKQEINLGINEISDMWAKLKKASPKSKKFQLIGNHCERIAKQVLSKMPEIESIIDLGSIFSFDGVETLESQRDELIIDKICYMHGFRTKLGDHAANNRMSTVVGHSHVGGVVFLRNGQETIFELNCGFIADTDSHVMSYTRQRKISRWTQGVGIIDSFGPRFIPFENKS